MNQDRTSKLARQKTGLEAPTPAPQFRVPEINSEQPINRIKNQNEAGFAPMTPASFDAAGPQSIESTLRRARRDKREEQQQTNPELNNEEEPQEEEMTEPDFEDENEETESMPEMMDDEPDLQLAAANEEKKKKQFVKRMILRLVLSLGCGGGTCCGCSFPLWFIIILGAALAIGAVALTGALFDLLKSWFL